MHVVASSPPTSLAWRGRIVDDAGELDETFPAIATAVARGTKRLVHTNVVDRSATIRAGRSTSHLWSR